MKKIRVFLLLLMACSMPVMAQMQAATMGSAVMASSAVQVAPLGFLAYSAGTALLNKFLNPGRDRVYNKEFASVEFVTKNGVPCLAQFATEQGWIYMPTGSVSLTKISMGSGEPTGKWRPWVDISEILTSPQNDKEYRRMFADDYFVGIAYDPDCNLWWLVPRNATNWWDWASVSKCWPTNTKVPCRQYYGNMVGNVSTFRFETETKVGKTRGYPHITFVKTDGTEILTSLTDPEVRRINALVGNTGTSQTAYRQIVDKETGRIYYVTGDESTFEAQTPEQDAEHDAKMGLLNPVVAPTPVVPAEMPLISSSVEANVKIYGKYLYIKIRGANGGDYLGNGSITIETIPKNRISVTRCIQNNTILKNNQYCSFDGILRIPALPGTTFYIKADGFCKKAVKDDVIILYGGK